MADFSNFMKDDAPKTKWRPVPLRPDERPEPYPDHALPPVIRDAVREVHSYVQAPLALVAASALSAVSTAVQARFSVQRDPALSGPATLYLLTVAESGERKTTIDKRFTASVREWEARQGRAFIEQRAIYDAMLEDWEREGRALDDRLKAGLHDAQLNTEFDPRVIHAMQKPKEPKLRTVLRGDDTPEALAVALADYPVASVISAEAGVIFGSHGMNADSVTRNLAQANAMWDGDVIDQGRLSRDRIRVEGMRVTMGLQVQPAVLEHFVAKTGGLARGIGWFARFLMSHPESTQGTRLYRDPPPDQPALRAFGDRVTTLLDIEPNFDEFDRLMPHYLRFDADAQRSWINFHNEVEEQIGYDDDFARVRDVASKAADNVARLACCFHAFAGEPGDEINQQTVQAACVLMRWYLREAIRFAVARDLTEDMRNAEALEAWLVRELKTRRVPEIRVNDARQKGPQAIRKKGKLDDALDLLVGHGRAFVYQPTGTKARFAMIAPQVMAEY